jgi:hypothetical protein
MESFSLKKLNEKRQHHIELSSMFPTLENFSQESLGYYELEQHSQIAVDRGSKRIKYEAHPVSKVPWVRLQKQNTISRKYLLQQIQQLRHLSYRGTNF